MRLFLLAGFALAMGTAAAAQAPATTGQIAAARAEGDALLKAAGALDLFDNETGLDSDGLPSGSTAIVLRHRASGYRCLLNPKSPENQIMVLAAPVRGENVGCQTRTLSDVRTLSLRRAPDESPSQLMAGWVEAIKARYASARPYEPTSVEPRFRPSPGSPIPPPPVPLGASLMSDDGADRIVLGKVGEWSVAYLFSGGREVAELGPILDSAWTFELLEAEAHARLRALSELAASPGKAD